MITSFDTRGLPISSKCSLREPSIQSKILKASKRGQVIRKFLGKVSRKSENCSISEKRTIQLNNRDIPGENPSLLMTVYLAKLCSFLKIIENAVPFVTGNSNLNY